MTSLDAVEAANDVDDPSRYVQAALPAAVEWFGAHFARANWTSPEPLEMLRQRYSAHAVGWPIFPQDFRHAAKQAEFHIVHGRDGIDRVRGRYLHLPQNTPLDIGRRLRRVVEESPRRITCRDLIAVGECIRHGYRRNLSDGARALWCAFLAEGHGADISIEAGEVRAVPPPGEEFADDGLIQLAVFASTHRRVLRLTPTSVRVAARADETSLMVAIDLRHCLKVGT